MSTLCHFLKPLPSPAGLDLHPCPCWSQVGLCINYLSSYTLPSFSLLYRSSAAPYLDVFQWFVFLGAILRADERPVYLHSLVIFRPIPCPAEFFYECVVENPCNKKYQARIHPCCSQKENEGRIRLISEQSRNGLLCCKSQEKLGTLSKRRVVTNLSCPWTYPLLISV